MSALVVASRGTASAAMLAFTMISPRFQTRFIGILCALSFVSSLCLSSVNSLASVCAVLLYSSLHPRHVIDWIFCINLLMLDLITSNVHWSIFLMVGVAYKACTFTWYWRAWSVGGIIVYFFPEMASCWIPLGYVLLTMSERYVWRHVRSNKKII